MAEIDADVEARMIPLRSMVPAPVSCGFHPFYVTAHLRTIFAAAGNVSIDPCPVGFKPLTAARSPISGGEGWLAGSE
jgi:hypothetical protein